MTFVREQLPEPLSYFESEGLVLTSRGKWRTTSCSFHGGSDSMRIRGDTGAWCCMSCGEKGGDVLAYHMAFHGMDFIDAAKALGAWVEDGKPQIPHKPKPLPAGDALHLLAFEAHLVAVAAGNVGNGVVLTQEDLDRVLLAAGRINQIREIYP
ncbi:CHC2 zinc finger domain-containing protein [Rhodoferax sp. GW822-FHT02A01]|uniref:CHC2 zinc finger domain-containing protein n=1 Tax=Rhodoferax sp. GW822-FHT02A01 TaxID=3141537 RepID=UPI00315C896C